MTIRYVVFEVSLQETILQMEEHIVAEARTHGALVSWLAIDANSQTQTVTIIGAFAAA